MFYDSYSTIDIKSIEAKINCPHCNNKLLISDSIDYSYLCKECDEYYSDKELNEKNSKQIENYVINAKENSDTGQKGIEVGSDKNFFQALDKARNFFENNTCAEVYITNNKNYICYLKNSSEECFYNEYLKIDLVPKSIISGYIKCWGEGKELPIASNRLYCADNDFFIAIDNIDGHCWTEEFNNEIDALNWLFEKEIGKDFYKEGEMNEI